MSRVGGAPRLKLHNTADVPFHDINVGVESLEGRPAALIEHVGWLDGGDEKTIALPGPHSRLQVTFSDVDDVLWRRRWVGHDLVLERLN